MCSCDYSLKCSKIKVASSWVLSNLMRRELYFFVRLIPYEDEVLFFNRNQMEKKKTYLEGKTRRHFTRIKLRERNKIKKKNHTDKILIWQANKSFFSRTTRLPRGWICKKWASFNTWRCSCTCRMDSAVGSTPDGGVVVGTASSWRTFPLLPETQLD